MHAIIRQSAWLLFALCAIIGGALSPSGTAMGMPTRLEQYARLLGMTPSSRSKPWNRRTADRTIPTRSMKKSAFADATRDFDAAMDDDETDSDSPPPESPSESLTDFDFTPTPPSPATVSLLNSIDEDAQQFADAYGDDALITGARDGRFEKILFLDSLLTKRPWSTKSLVNAIIWSSTPYSNNVITLYYS